MNYKQQFEATLRDGYENLAGSVVLSLGITLALIPLAIGAVVGTSLVIVGMLWTTSLLLGIGVVAMCQFTTTVVARGVSIDLWSTITPAIEDPIWGSK